MTKPTHQEQIELERFVRSNESNLKFLRETPRGQRNIPFAEEANFDKPTFGEVLIWLLIVVGLIVFTMFVLNGGIQDVATNR